MDKTKVIAICQQEESTGNAINYSEDIDMFLINLFNGDCVALSNAWRLSLSFKDLACLFVGDEYEGVFMQTNKEITYPTIAWDFIQEAIEASGYELC